MKRLANERKYVEDMIKSKTLNVSRPGKDINSLIKYLYEENPNLTKQELIALTNEFLLDIVQDEKAVKRWQVSIREYVDTFMSYAKDFKGLSHVESVSITKNELIMIEKLEDERLEYIGFSLLVYLKVQNAITGRHDNVYCPSGEEHIKMIKKLSGLKITVTKTALAINVLQDVGYTENGIGGAVSCKLNYVDNEDEVVIEIRDFDTESISLYYTWYIYGGRLIYCSECGKLVHVKSEYDYSTKYCEPCARESMYSSQKEYKQRKKC